ncbi:MAG: hypothetical protein DHS80DRAFT_32484 [Piptocephalis tieghemiana]|nr:MAG: hypothetical protein DHS80DRAFT_32484 [Piptocephalis tieghemiana]
MTDRRSTRKRKQRSTDPGNASAAHYVGYVEDEESVEAIMRKFEELERIQQELSLNKEDTPMIPAEKSTLVEGGEDKASGEGTNPPIAQENEGDVPSGGGKQAELTEEQLEEVFRRTSSFTLLSAMTRSMVEETDVDWEMSMLGDDIDAEFIPDQGMDEDDEDYFDDGWSMGSEGGKRRSTAGGGARRRLLSRQALLERYREVRVQDQAGNVYTLKKKTNILDPSLPTYSRIPPPPIPIGWARRIVPLEEQSSLTSPPGSKVISTPRILSLDFDQLPRAYQAIYADPPLLLDGEPEHPCKMSLEDFAKLPLASHVKAGGFLFVWTPKSLISRMLKVTSAWGFRYVENICWVKLDAAHQRIHDGLSTVIGESKMTLLILRKEGDLELRHQRNPDVVFDFVAPRPPGQIRDRKPDFLYKVIETLLPGAKWSVDLEAGQGFLELWAMHPKGRPGWTTVHEIPKEEASKVHEEWVMGDDE